MQIRNAGFGILDSMLTLTLLATVITGIILFNNYNHMKKDAKVLSNQTEVFAIVFAKYMTISSVRDSMVTTAKNSPVTLSPQSIGSAWPLDLSPNNRYGQTPCVTVFYNQDSEALEAIMYYVGGRSDLSANSLNLVRAASVLLGGKGGILLNGEILGNSAWRIDSSSTLLSGATQCGVALANNSLAINLDLLPQWNQVLQSAHSILRGEDNTAGVKSLPGRLKNVNTLKSNIYFNQGSGVIFNNSNGINPTKLSVLYNAKGTDVATLELGNKTKLISDSFQANLYRRAGDVCNSWEEGKTVAHQGENDSINRILAKNTVVCSYNPLLCVGSAYCYLSSLSNQITFQNLNHGIQNAQGEFICPKSVPFAMNVQAGLLGGGQVYTIANNGEISPNSVSAKLENHRIFIQMINCPSSGCNPGIRTDYKSGVIDGIGQLISIDLATVTGINVATIALDNSNSNYQVIEGTIGSYTTPIGYRVNPNIGKCNEICASLDAVIGNKWQLLGTQRSSRIGLGVSIDNANLGCGCERADFSGVNTDNYNGIAVVIKSTNAIILSATCSNNPLYHYNN